MCCRGPLILSLTNDEFGEFERHSGKLDLNIKPIQRDDGTIGIRFLDFAASRREIQKREISCFYLRGFFFVVRPEAGHQYPPMHSKFLYPEPKDQMILPYK